MSENREAEALRYAYESALTRNHHVIKWLVIVIVILIISLVGTNLAWVIYENQFETYEMTEENEVQSVQFGEDNTVVGGDMIVNADSDGENQENN